MAKQQIGARIPSSQTSHGSSDLTRLKAMLAMELEVTAKKVDRYGWDRERGSAVHDRLVMDWVNALMDYPLDRVQAACAAWIRENPRRMPNEGDILAVLNPPLKPETYSQRIIREYGAKNTLLECDLAPSATLGHKNANRHSSPPENRSSDALGRIGGLK